MKKGTIAVIGLMLLFTISSDVLAKNTHEKHSRPRDILAFETMYAVDGPFIGDANAIRGVIGDELPWTIAHHVKGKLETNGHLKIKVRGLVFTDDPEVPVELRGKNDETEFRALVSCLSEEGETVVTKNVTSAGFPATESGDSDIDATIELPEPCVAPIVFILAGTEDKWFAVTGFEKPPTPTPPS
jgi:hypothetical protein